MLKRISMHSRNLLNNLLAGSAFFNLLYMCYRLGVVLVCRRERLTAADTMVGEQRKSKLAVIGCGPSINELKADYFDQLQDYDVTVFSYAALLPVEIDYYLYEIPSGTLLTHHEEFLYPELLEKVKARRLKNILLKNPHSDGGRFYRLFSPVLSSMTFPIHVRSLSKLKTLIKLIQKLGLSRKYFFQARASLFSTCFWADAVGYEEILLIGIDLNTSKYFYEDEDNQWGIVNIPNPFPDEVLTKDIHPTNDEDKGLKLEDAMKTLKGCISAKICVANPESALAGIFESKQTP